MIAFKDLVVGITTDLELRGFKPLVEGLYNRGIGDLPTYFVKNVMEATGLLFGGAKNKIPNSRILILAEFVQQKVKLFMKAGCGRVVSAMVFRGVTPSGTVPSIAICRN